MRSRHDTGKRNYQQGQWAETVAAWFLRLKGYGIVARRVRGHRGTGVGEIDIIAKRGKTLAFVEVKLRQDRDGGRHAVSLQQQQRIVRGAAQFLQSYDAGHRQDCRFDVMVITPWRWPIHIQNAFQAHVS